MVANEANAHIIWEDDSHMALLSIYPNTEGFSVVIPKKHISSYAFDASDAELTTLVLAAKKVAKILDNYFDDVGRTGMMFEGFGVDHLHAKLFPMHGTKMDEWRQIKSDENKYFKTYEGYISSHDSDRAEDDILKNLAKDIRKSYVR